jgi:phosphatidate cytidylyltransferase
VLLTRVITALALLPLVLGMLFAAPDWLWALFGVVIALLACWEWSRMCGLTRTGRSLYLAASAAVGAFLWLMHMGLAPGNFPTAAMTAFVLAATFWIFAAPYWLSRRLRPSPSTCAAAGWVVIWPMWFALIVLREVSPWLLLALAAMVWAADVAAYFAGKRFGRRKLAPAISPGKTWEGVAGGLAGVLLYGLVLCAIARRWDTPLAPVFEPGWGIPALAAMLVLVAVSIVGDLFESWMKRGAGLKDSSNLLPGHGGILDRIDALTSTLPVAALALYLAR